MLPFVPEPIDELKKRFKAAVQKPYYALLSFSDPATTPGNKREHVFDCEDGIRMIISRDYAGNDEVIHMSASVDEQTFKGTYNKELLKTMKERFKVLAGYEIPHSCTVIFTEKGIPHWIFKLANLN